MVEKIGFKYQSPENLCRLLCTITFENNPDNHDWLWIWHQRFDQQDADSLFETFMTELFPEGGKIDVKEIELLTERAFKFLQTDKSCRRFIALRDKSKYNYWVYDKINEVVVPCGFAKHQETVSRLVAEFFDYKLDDYDRDYIYHFILDNYELQSDNSTIDKIANDVDWIIRSAYINKRRGEQYDT